MTWRNVAIVAVVDGDRLVGVFSERDVVERVVDCHLDPRLTPVEQVMTHGLVVGEADEDYRAALKRLERAGLRHLPVVSGGQVLSMLSISELLMAEIQDADEELHYFQEYVCLVPPGVAPVVFH
jgi:CBS domain-containing protein